MRKSDLQYLIVTTSDGEFLGIVKSGEGKTYKTGRAA